MSIGNPERQKGSRALVTKKRGSYQAPQLDELVDVSDEDDDEPTMVHTALIGQGLPLPGRPRAEAAEATAEEWHFQISVGLEDLERLADLGLVSNETLAWRPGLTEWKRVEEIPQLGGSMRPPRDSSLRPPAAPRFDDYAPAEDPATAPLAAPEPLYDARRAPTEPPQARRTSTLGGGGRSVLPPPPVPPAVGLRRPTIGQSVPAPPLAYTHTVPPVEEAASAPSALWDLPTNAAAPTTDDAPAFRTGLSAKLKSLPGAAAIGSLRTRLGPRNAKIALAASLCLVLVAGTWIVSASSGGGVEQELQAAARPALEAVKQSSDAVRTATPPAAEPAPAPAAEAPAPPATGAAIEGKPLDVTALATAEQAPAPEKAAPSAPKAAAAVMSLAAAPAAAAPAAAAPAAAGKSFDAGAAQRAVDKAVGAASSCVDEGARVPGSVTVTFGPSGKVKSAKLGRSLSSPELERCVVGAFRRASVPAFSGADGSVTKTFRLKG